MSNFDFLKQTLPELHEECVRAESYLSSDTRSACFYSRRGAELLLNYLYDVLDLEDKRNLDSKINNPLFYRQVGPARRACLESIRRNGNNAVHRTDEVDAKIALKVLEQLHHVMIWAAFHHSANPDVVDLGARFDPKLAARNAPLSREQLKALAEKIKAQDEALAAERAKSAEAIAARDAENARLREQIAAAQAKNTRPDTRDYNEAQTRADLIDLYLRESGWDPEAPNVREYAVTGMPTPTGAGYADYVLWGADGQPLAVVEAKRTGRSAKEGQQQAKLYADALEQQFGRRPVMFLSNGYETYLWDDNSSTGYPPRLVHGFYTRDQLELLHQRRSQRQPLTAASIAPGIADRHYQHRAIKAVGEVFDANRREALLVMATGSGKTRTVIALIDQLTKANWAKNVLFLADRSALVTQAERAFKEHLPSLSPVNLVANRTGQGRVYLCTYQSMLGLIQTDDAVGPYGGQRRFGPGHFDLIVVDEAHRSIYDRYGTLLDYFDGLLLGLTATPKEDIDRNTYGRFNLPDGVPTDSYSLDEAVADGFLVPPRGVQHGTKFLQRGTRYDDLSPEEQAEWDSLEWGEDGPPVAVTADEFNRFIFNKDTVDKVLEILMTQGHHVAAGDRLAKTIVFAKNQRHAEFIEERFNANWPQYKGQFARVITYRDSHAQSLIDEFSDTHKLPQIAISVDMLDTGIDVPDVANLVLFKPVYSKSKFWQMIGRGTRLRPDLFGPGQDKQDFYVLDVCGNLEYFNQDLPDATSTRTRSLGERIFEARLDLVTLLDAEGAATDDDASLRHSAARTLHAAVAGMDLGNVLVRSHRRAVEQFREAHAWGPAALGQATPEQQVQLRALAALPTAAVDDEEAVKRFDLLVLKRQVAQLGGDASAAERVRARIQGTAQMLLAMTSIPAVKEQLPLLQALARDDWWTNVSLGQLEEMRIRVRGLAPLLERSSRNPVYTNFEDEVLDIRQIDLTSADMGVNIDRVRENVLKFVREHRDHVTIQRVWRNKQLTEADLAQLEEMFASASVATSEQLEQVAAPAGGLGLFLRGLVGLDRHAAKEAFARLLPGIETNQVQVQFINMLIDELTATGVMDPSRLYEQPYSESAATNVDIIFPQEQIEIIVDTLQVIKQHAMPIEVA